MNIDFLSWAKRLAIVDVWSPGNPTGWITPRVLYDPRTKDSGGNTRAPTQTQVQWWMDHGTVGANTLRFWGEGGSVHNGTWTLAHYLDPHEATQYADGQTHDTTNVIFKMVPDGYACNHTGMCIGPIGNHNAIGIEYESLQNGTADISETQLIKGALVYAHEAARLRLMDAWRVAHGLVATPWGRRVDPWAGRLDVCKSWAMVQAIREDARIWAYWGLPQPTAGY